MAIEAPFFQSRHHIDSEPGYSYTLDSDLQLVLANPGLMEKEIINLILDDQAIEELSTETVRLEQTTLKTLPDTPWYITISIVLGLGLITAFLISLHF